MNENDKAEILKGNIDRCGEQQGKRYALEEPALTKTSKSLGKMDTRATFLQSINPSENRAKISPD